MKNAIFAMALFVLTIVGCGTIAPGGYSVQDMIGLVGAHTALAAVKDYDADPSPKPQPGGVCENCNGVGKVGDGRTMITCPVCDGSGKTPAVKDVVTPSTDAQNVSMEPAEIDKCPNPDCTCEDCQCDPGLCGKVAHNDAKGVTQKVDTRPIIYFFTAEDCVYCPPMKALADQLKAEGHRVWPMDIDDEANSRFVVYYNVTRVPQFVTVTPQGAEIRRTTPGVTTRARVLGIAPLKTTPTNFNASPPVKNSAPVFYSQPAYQVQQPQRTGWFRGRMTRSVCGPGGCR